MSLNQKLSALVCVGLICGWGISKFSETSRAPASLEAPKLRLKPWTPPTQKVGEAISVRVIAVSGLPDRDNQEITLRAEVTLNRAIDTDLEWEWNLPPGVEIVSGETKDAWHGLEVGQTASVEISLLGVSKEGLVKTVTFMAHGNSGSVKLGGAGHFATNTLQEEPRNDFEKADFKSRRSLLKDKLQQ